MFVVVYPKGFFFISHQAQTTKTLQRSAITNYNIEYRSAHYATYTQDRKYFRPRKFFLSLVYVKIPLFCGYRLSALCIVSTAPCTKDRKIAFTKEIFGYIQDNSLLFRPNCCPLLVQLCLSWLLHLNTPWCKILYIATSR